jgi:ribonuclease-3
MARAKNMRQKRALFQPFTRRDPSEPDVPEVKGIDMTPYQAFSEEHLGFTFHDPNLWVTALTHRSYVNEHKKSTSAHNERLEFLGDAVLELVTTEFLFKDYDLPEGFLSSWRSALVRTESIRGAGDTIGYAPLLRMSRGEKQGSEQAKLHIVANAFEALIGAIYLDQGFEAARTFVSKHILYRIDEILEDGSWRDPKSYLQQISQREDNAMPDYRVISEVGPDHAKNFVVGAFISGKEIGRGEGSSKQVAQQEAAREGIEFYRVKSGKKKPLDKV